MEITNDEILYAVFGSAIDKAVQYTTDKILEEYKDLIERIVYGVGIGNAYEQTGQFEESWKKNTYPIRRGGHGEIYQDNSVMKFVTSGSMEAPNQHGSFLSGQLYGGALTEIIYEGLSGDLFNFGAPHEWWQDARDAWTPLIQELEGGKLDKWFREGFKQATGMSLYKI